MYDEFKKSVGWDDKHMIGAHIRRTDLAIVDSTVRCPHPLTLAFLGLQHLTDKGHHNLPTSLDEVADASVLLLGNAMHYPLQTVAQQAGVRGRNHTRAQMHAGNYRS